MKSVVIIAKLNHDLVKWLQIISDEVGIAVEWQRERSAQANSDVNRTN